MKKILGFYVMMFATVVFMVIMVLIAKYILMPLRPIIGDWGIVGVVMFVFPLIFVIILNLIEKVRKK